MHTRLRAFMLLAATVAATGCVDATIEQFQQSQAVMTSGEAMIAMPM